MALLITLYLFYSSGGLLSPVYCYDLLVLLVINCLFYFLFSSGLVYPRYLDACNILSLRSMVNMHTLGPTSSQVSVAATSPVSTYIK